MATGKIQAIRASAKTWTAESFAKWLKKKGHKNEIEEEDGFLVAVQEDADQFDRVKSKRVGRGLVFAIGFSGPAPSKEPGGRKVPFWDVPIDDLLAGLLKS